MPNYKKIVDKCLPHIGVVLDGAFVNRAESLNFFSIVGYVDRPANKETHQITEEMLTCKSYHIWCSAVEEHISLGPTITVSGPNHSAKLTIPWMYVIAIFQFSEGIQGNPMGYGVNG